MGQAPEKRSLLKSKGTTPRTGGSPQTPDRPLWVNRVTLTAHRSLPVLPDWQTFSGHSASLKKCHKRKCEVCPKLTDRGKQMMKKPAQCPTKTACAISLPEANTRSHPRNNIVATVANTDLTTAAIPNANNPIPDTRNHPQYWTTSWGIWTSIAWILPIMSRSLASGQSPSLLPLLRAPSLLGGEAAVDGIKNGQSCLFNRRNGAIDRETSVFLQKLGVFLG